MTITYGARPGENITTTANAMAALANKTGETVTASFNDVPLSATPGCDPSLIVSGFYEHMQVLKAEYDRKHAAWLKTPEGIEQQRKDDELAAKEKALMEGPMPTFALKDAAAWNKLVEVNTDPYGAACVRYAAYWASLMEAAMEKGHNGVVVGKTVQVFAEQCSHDADVGGITGFMYGAAVAMLSKCWVHGEALRRWHNKESQIGTEGDKANETGGVLNPAVLSIDIGLGKS